MTFDLKELEKILSLADEELGHLAHKEIEENFGFIEKGLFSTIKLIPPILPSTADFHAIGAIGAAELGFWGKEGWLANQFRLKAIKRRIRKHKKELHNKICIENQYCKKIKDYSEDLPFLYGLAEVICTVLLMPGITSRRVGPS